MTDEPDGERSRIKRGAEVARDHTFREVQPAGLPKEHLDLKDVEDVSLPITVELGQCTMLVRDVLELKQGSVITLDKLAGEMSDIYVGDLFLAKGEIVVIGDALHVRIAEVVGMEEGQEDQRNATEKR